MEAVESLLKKLGLSSTEITLYLNGLRFNKINVAVLVRESQIKRTTAYHALDTLVQKGLASQSKEDGKLFYRMTPADELERVLQNKKQQLENQIDEVKQLASQFPVAGIETKLPDVSNYYGMHGVQSAIDRALYCQDRFWRIISPRNNYFRNSSQEYIDYFKDKRAERGIEAKSLWESSMKKGRAITEEGIVVRQPRVMPASMDGKFKSSIIIFDDKVLIVSSFAQQYATLITSTETAETFSLIFDAIWDISKPVKIKQV